MKTQTAILLFLSAGFASLSAVETRIFIPPMEQKEAIARMKAIVIPQVDVEATTLGEVLDFIRLRNAEPESPPTKPDFNFVIMDAALAKKPITLKLRNIPLDGLLTHLAELSGAMIHVHHNIVEFHAGSQLDPERLKMPAGRAVEDANAIVIPRMDFQETALEEALDFLRMRTTEIAPSSKLKVIIDPSIPAETIVPELRLKKVGLADALRVIAIQTGCRLTADATTLRIVKP